MPSSYLTSRKKWLRFLNYAPTAANDDRVTITEVEEPRERLAYPFPCSRRFSWMMAWIERRRSNDGYSGHEGCFFLDTSGTAGPPWRSRVRASGKIHLVVGRLVRKFARSVNFDAKQLAYFLLKPHPKTPDLPLSRTWQMTLQRILRR